MKKHLTHGYEGDEFYDWFEKDELEEIVEMDYVMASEGDYRYIGRAILDNDKDVWFTYDSLNHEFRSIGDDRYCEAIENKLIQRDINY